MIALSIGQAAWGGSPGISHKRRKHGHQVTLLSYLLPGVGTTTSVDEHDGIRIVRCAKPVLPGWHPGRVARTIEAAAEAVRDKLSRERWDVVHIHTAYTGAGAFRALGRGPRYIYTMHSPIALEQKINWKNEGLQGRFKTIFGLRRLRLLEGELLQACCRIHTLSEFTRGWVEHFHGLSHRVKVIPYWRRAELVRTVSKSEARTRLGWPQDEKILFTIRNHGPRYGIDIAIRAVAPLAVKKACRFYIGGDGELRPRLERLTAELGAGERIHFTGRLSDEDLLLAYQAADLFVLPTLALECFGLISIEALSFGCPVIATQAGAIPEVLYPILPNCLVPPGDVVALRDKIGQFLDGSLEMPTADELVAYVDQNYDRDVVVPRLMHLLESPNGCP